LEYKPLAAAEVVQFGDQLADFFPQQKDRPNFFSTEDTMSQAQKVLSAAERNLKIHIRARNYLLL
jgi:hypothetical protein